MRSLILLGLLLFAYTVSAQTPPAPKPAAPKPTRVHAYAPPSSACTEARATRPEAGGAAGPGVPCRNGHNGDGLPGDDIAGRQRKRLGGIGPKRGNERQRTNQLHRHAGRNVSPALQQRAYRHLRARGDGSRRARSRTWTSCSRSHRRHPLHRLRRLRRRLRLPRRRRLVRQASHAPCRLWG